MTNDERDMQITETHTMVKGMQAHCLKCDDSIEILHTKTNNNKEAIATIRGAGIAVASVCGMIGLVIVIMKAVG